MDQNNTYNNIPEGAPSAEQPIYHYTRPEQNVVPEPPAYQPPQYEAPQPPQKKPEKPLTKKALIPLIAGVAAVSLVLGLVGGALGARLWNKQEVIPEGTAVVYQTAKLKDADGKTAKETLAIPEVAELVKDSVVEITTEQIVTGSFMQQYVSEGAGSGVIITADGYLVTNHHVIEGATNINVRLADGKEYKAKLIGSDAKTDLAVIKIDAKELKPAAFGASSELLVGEEVVAVGNPLGKLGGTVTKGIISALDREITIDNTTMRLLQTDTAINPGNSGGGMFNTSGQLVGVINAKSAGEEIEEKEWHRIIKRERTLKYGTQSSDMFCKHQSFWEFKRIDVKRERHIGIRRENINALHTFLINKSTIFLFCGFKYQKRYAMLLP